jgi:Tol biopolymer transport system component
LTLSAGSKVGPYEILAPLGAGGMGEVYRARDPKLDRVVAVKVLPTHLDEHADALLRFEREAKAVAALSHPNILAIHDFGTDGGRAYAVTELLEGETLRGRLGNGPLPLRKAIEAGAQIARGLAAAHDKGIVHRDLKPENVFLTTDGRVKILDFGLARADGAIGQDDTNSPTVTRQTDPGTVLGTVGYMSPEQVRGKVADSRSDIFSLGCVLHEMLTGRRTFARDTAAETMTAILREDAPDIATSGVAAPPPLERLVRHCLEKNREERFQSARDVAFDLETILTPSDQRAPSLVTRGRVSASRPVRLAAALGLAAAALTLAFWLGRRAGTGGRLDAEPSFVRITFSQGMVWTARFAPDGKTVIYSAAWDGAPIRLFTTHTDNPESSPLNLPDANLFSISASGELAVSLGHRHEGWMGAGTLARTPLVGGGARPVLEDVREADWAPDGSDLAIARRVSGLERLEYPPGKVLYETGGFVSHIRFSPKGNLIAFVDHPLFADDIGSINVVDLAGRRTVLAREPRAALRGLAWSPAGDELWFTAARYSSDDMSLWAVDLRGRERLLLAAPTGLILFDVSRDGRILIGRETSLRHVEALVPGNPRPRDFSIRSNSMTRSISADARMLVVTDQNVEGYAPSLRPTDGSPPVRLGEGDGYGLSPDGQWVLALTSTSSPPRRLLLHPTGTGPSRELPNPEHLVVDSPRWLPDGRIVLFARTPGRGLRRGYVIDPRDGSPPRSFTDEGVEPVRWWAIPASPDGTRVVARAANGLVCVYRLDGGAPEPIGDLSPLDLPLEWTADGRALFVARLGELPWKVRRRELATGRETPWTEIAPGQVAGARLSQVFLTPDGRYWAHSYSRMLVDLYAATGIR